MFIYMREDMTMLHSSCVEIQVQIQSLFVHQISLFTDNHEDNKETCCERIRLYLSNERIRLHLGDVIVHNVLLPNLEHTNILSLLRVCSRMSVMMNSKLYSHQATRFSDIFLR